MEAFELAVGQFGYVFGIAAGFAPVRRVGEEPVVGISVNQGIGARVDALHLVVDDAFDGQFAGQVAFLGQLQVVAFLAQRVFRQIGMIDGVAVDLGQIVEVLLYIAGDRVDGLVVIGHGVDECGHAHFQHLDERVLDGIAARAAKDGVFQDVRQPGIVGRRGGEGDGEKILRIVRRVDVQDAGAGAEVFEFVSGGAQVGQRRDAFDLEAVVLLPGLQFDATLAHSVLLGLFRTV